MPMFLLTHSVSDRYFITLQMLQACKFIIGDAIEACCSLWTSNTLNRFSTSSSWC